MPTLSVAQLAEATGGALIQGDRDARVTAYVIDSRRARPGAAFFALAGNRTDGHKYLAQAAAAGALAAVVEHEPPAGEATPATLIRVDDGSAALVRAGTWIRRHFDDVQWIAVTGSNGKTTTKEMIATGLADGRRVHRTPGNFNNHLGVPLTLLALPDDAEAAVVELAMNHAGEIAMLTDITDPDVGLVTNIHAVHMANFNTIDDVAAAKGELYASLRDDAVAVVNIDELHCRVQAMRHVGPQVSFGQHPNADVRLVELENRYLPGARMVARIGEQSLELQLRIGGAHAAFDALAALAAVVASGGDPLAAAERIEQVEAVDGRGRVHQLDRGIVVVDDTYNSSPPALASVLEALRLTDPEGRRVLIMGDMLELGPMEEALHREAGRRAAAAGVALLVAVGTLARAAAEAAHRAGVTEVHHHADSRKAAEAIRELLRRGDLVVVKGSRSMRLGRVVRALTQPREVH